MFPVSVTRRRGRTRTALAVPVLVLWALLEPGAAGARAAEEFPDKLALLAMLRDGAFEALDARLSAYQEGYEAGRTPERLASFGGGGSTLLQTFLMESQKTTH